MSLQAAYNYVLNTAKKLPIFLNFKSQWTDFKSVQAEAGTVPGGKFLDTFLTLIVHYPQVITTFTNSSNCYQVLKVYNFLTLPPA